MLAGSFPMLYKAYDFPFIIPRYILMTSYGPDIGFCTPLLVMELPHMVYNASVFKINAAAVILLAIGVGEIFLF